LVPEVVGWEIHSVGAGVGVGAVHPCAAEAAAGALGAGINHEQGV
jgi:hypothetical protein